MRIGGKRILLIMTVKAHPNLENISKDVASIGQSIITWNICKAPIILNGFYF